MKLSISIEFSDAARAAAKDINVGLVPAFGAVTPVQGDLVQFPGQPLLFVVVARIWQPKDQENVELRVMLDLHSHQPLSIV